MDTRVNRVVGEVSSDAEAGRQAARDLWRHGLREAKVEDPLTPGFARAALAELEILQQGTPGVLLEVLAGAQMSAEQLNVEAFHGLVEVIQNADDLGASEVRVAIKRNGARHRLLVAHNGERVRLQHVIAMTLAFISTKRDDPRAKGRFGIGLKTLGRLGDKLTVHCTPYDFMIEGNQVRTANRMRKVPGFYDPASAETLIELHLRKGFDPAEFEGWFASLGSEALVFLDTVGSLRLVSSAKSKTLVHHKLTRGAPDVLKLPGCREQCKRVRLREPRTGRSWEKYEIERKMPQSLKRRYKARHATTPMAIAVPGQSGEGRLYAGLPLGVRTGLPILLNAQFDIDVARRGIQHEHLNTWLFERLGELAASVALFRLENDPKAAWVAIPLRAEQTEQHEHWLSNRIAELIDTIHARVARKFRVHVRGKQCSLRTLAYEAAPLDGLLTQSDISGLRRGQMLLPAAARDKRGRWRAVLEELGDATCISVDESLQLLDWEDESLGTRDVNWFISLGRAAIDADLGEKLWVLRSVVATSGERIVPPLPHFEGELLLRKERKDSLAARLGLAHVIHPAYLSRRPDAVVVRNWLDEKGILRETADPESTVRALAARDTDQTMRLGDLELLLLRNALVSLEPHEQKELGQAIGHVIEVEVRRWKGSKRVTETGRPADAYLPSTIEDRKDGWSKAAGRTEGLAWIHARYGRVLRTRGRRKAGSGEPRSMGARTFFGLLGAEVAPRLIEPAAIETRYNVPATPIDREKLPSSQREVLRGLERHATHLQEDRVSPDLLLALRNLSQERRRGEHRTRVRALMSTLEREWQRIYQSHMEAVAVYSYGTWHTAGMVPASWLARAGDVRWLISEDRKKRLPRELAVRTPATVAIFGSDRSRFAAELDETHAQSAPVRALGITTDPQVSEMVEQITALRDGRASVDEENIKVRYAAIAAACKKAEPSPDDMVGDLSVRKLRARFGSRQGLVHAGSRWFPPSKVYLGAPIFGGRRPFVSEHTTASILWQVLRVTPPSVRDCLDVLAEIAQGPPDAQDEQILHNIYLYLERHNSKITSRERAALRNLPLWTGASWHTARPIYIVDDDELALALSAHLPVWMRSVAPAIMPKLLKAVDATLLTDERFSAVVHEDAFEAGAAIRRQFVATVELLRDWLARHDPEVCESLSVSWEELAHARLAVDPTLQIELRLSGRTPVGVRARSHLERSSLTLYFADSDATGQDDVGGRVLASLFTSGDRDKVALAWSLSWDKASKGERGTLTLAQDAEEEESLSSLFEQAKGAVPIRTQGREKRTPKAAEATYEADTPLPVRRLKQIEGLSEKSVEMTGGGAAGATKKGRRRGLQDVTPPGSPIGTSKAAPRTAPLDYSPEEKEDLAIRVLQLAINGSATGLKDYRHLRGVGADALDKLRRYFEIKAHYGALPNNITLTANEAERAFREGEKFFLAVIAGLETGYETVVKIFANPLKTLDLAPDGSVTLTGITGEKPALEVRFPSR